MVTNASRKLRLQRICATWVAVGYCCLTLIVPFHQHMHPKGNAVPAAASSIAGSQGGHAGLAASPAVIHCAACEWEAVVGSQAAHEFVFQPQLSDTTPEIAAPVRALRSIALATSSRGPPLV